MNNTFEIAKTKEIRKNIVERLYMLYPEKVTILFMKTMLGYRGQASEREFKKAIFYLEGKGYLKIFEKENYPESEIELTSLGINLVEGDVLDMGVIIDE